MSSPARSARGQARRAELLEAVVADVRDRGLVGWSLRRAAAAAGTTHKVLLYHFSTGEALLSEALGQLRDGRIHATAPVASSPGKGLRQVWAALRAEAAEARVLDQATGLAIYDPDGFGHLGREATDQYLPWLTGLCPTGWPRARREATATLLLAVLRGLLADVLTSGDERRVSAALEQMALLLDASVSDSRRGARS